MTTTKQPKLTLVLYPNTFGIGYVICDGPKEILGFGLKKVRPISHYKYLKKVKWLLDFCKPNLVILSDYKNRSISNRQKKIIDAIVEKAKAENLVLQSYSRSQIKNVFASFDATTKYDIAMTILGWYPELKNKQPHRRLPWMAEHYQMGVFDAFALMLTHFYLE